MKKERRYTVGQKNLLEKANGIMIDGRKGEREREREKDNKRIT